MSDTLEDQLVAQATMRAPTRGERIADMVRAVYEGAAAQPIGRILDLLGATNLRGMADSFTTPESGVRMGEMPGPPEGKILDKIKGIRAYHGSPHDFDKFSMSKVGTGEGAQAYGHGLYFAESEDVAKSYRQLGSRKGWQVGDAIYEPGSVQYRAAEALGTEQLDPSFDAIAYLQDRWKKYGDDVSAHAVGYVKQWKADGSKVRRPGAMYEVEIKASPDEMLDFDAPLTEQPAKVQEAMRTLWQERGGTLDGRTLPPFAAHSGSTGESAYAAISSSFAPKRGGNEAAQKAGAEALQRHGVKGIRYRDAMSRGGAGDGTRNYVVFDEKLVDILRKYGVAGAIGAGYTMSQIKAAQGETQ